MRFKVNLMNQKNFDLYRVRQKQQHTRRLMTPAISL